MGLACGVDVVLLLNNQQGVVQGGKAGDPTRLS